MAVLVSAFVLFCETRYSERPLELIVAASLDPTKTENVTLPVAAGESAPADDAANGQFDPTTLPPPPTSSPNSTYGMCHAPQHVINTFSRFGYWLISVHSAGT